MKPSVAFSDSVSSTRTVVPLVAGPLATAFANPAEGTLSKSATAPIASKRLVTTTDFWFMTDSFFLSPSGDMFVATLTFNHPVGQTVACMMLVLKHQACHTLQALFSDATPPVFMPFFTLCR
jgi:hypothetical protein